MTVTRLPDLQPSRPHSLDEGDLERRLRRSVDGEVRFDQGSRAAYSTDSSNYRQVPVGVVVPRTVDAAVEAVRICAELGVAIVSRGGGTSLAGQSTNHAIVIDWSKYCRRIGAVDRDRSSVIVEPGVVLDQLNDAVADEGLMFGPKPATHAHCTLGGMIGNNSCGSSAQAYGKTVDNVLRLEVLCYDGTRHWVGGESERGGLDAAAAESDDARWRERMQALARIAAEYGDDIRERFPQIPRRVSGYNLDDLLPERDPDLARMLVGSEGTLVTILRAELRLVPVVPATTTVLVGFDDIAAAADAVPSVLEHDPLILEGMDRVLIDHERDRRMHPDALRDLPHGRGWLLIQVGGKDRAEADDRAKLLVDDLGDDVDGLRVLDDPDEEKLIMEVREAALGATAWVADEHSTWPGWEDAAVPPERLGDYLRDFRRLLDDFGYGAASLYGHFGQGCVHTRIPFELGTLRGVQDFRRFIERAARLVVSYGGSLSGEHGDGQARGALLPIMYGDRVMEAFRRAKAIFDPRDRMNPGKVVEAADPAENLRLGADFAPGDPDPQYFSYPDDRGRFSNAALRCVGVGACRNHSGGVMCPSYRATGEEEHSTRGRARLLAEMVRGEDSALPDGWRSTEVRDALDLCLSCKGCRSDCPVDVDMATYKAEFLAHHYAKRLRPASHYTMGWLPLWSRVAALAPQLVNALTHAPGISRLVARLGGLDRDRPLPRFASTRFRRPFRRRPPAGSGLRGDVLLWPDTFTDAFHPGIARAAVEVLEDAGYRVHVPEQALCCGLTWISTGQLATARRVLGRTARKLAPMLRRGVPLVGLEPSCTAVFRSDGPELLPDDPDIALLARSTVTLAQLLDATEGWTPPQIDRDALMQPHCHQHAVLGTDADERVLGAAGVRLEQLGGCCGLAGNFGFEAGHLEVSMQVAETELLPAVRRTQDETVVLADGFSCRTQLEQSGEGRQAAHLAELLAAGIRNAIPVTRPEDGIADRPAAPQVIRRPAPQHPPFAADKPS